MRKRSMRAWIQLAETLDNMDAFLQVDHAFFGRHSHKPENETTSVSKDTTGSLPTVTLVDASPR